MTRRFFTGLALASVLRAAERAQAGLPGLPHFPPKAKRVICLFQSGGPSQIELFDYKPRLIEFQGAELPESVRNGQRLTGMSASQSTFPVVPSKFAFARRGESGAWVSDLLPTPQDRRPPHLPQIGPHRGDQPRPRRHHDADRLPAGRPAQPGRVGLLRNRLRDRRSARLLRHDLELRRRPAPLRSSLGQRFPAQPASGRKVPLRRPTRCCSSPIPRASPTGKRRAYLDALGELNQASYDEFGDPEIAPASRSTRWRFACRLRSPS